MRRPLCMLCLLLILLLCVLDGLGLPILRGNPLPTWVQEGIESDPDALVQGVVWRTQETEYGTTVYLSHAYRIVRSEFISIQNIKAYVADSFTAGAGSAVLLSGTLDKVPAMRNPGEFNSRQYYACSHIYYVLKKAQVRKVFPRKGVRQALFALQGRMGEILQAMAGEDAPLFEAMLLGNRQDLSEEKRRLYQMGGIVHILAISGLHISLLGMGLFGLLKKAGMSLRLSALVSLGFMLPFGIMTGSGISTLRALSMFLLVMGARLLGECYDLLTALAVTALLLLAESPAYLYTASFQLSFAAVGGIGLASFLWQRRPGQEEQKGRIQVCLLNWLGSRGKYSWAKRLGQFTAKLGGTLWPSLAVWFATLPILLWFYGEVSLAGLALNLAVLPTAGLVLGNGIAALLAGGLVWAAAGKEALASLGFLVLPARLVLAAYEGLCRLAARFPWSVWVAGRPALWQVAVYYCLLAAALYRGAAKRKRIPFYLALALVLISWRGHGNLKMTFLDVGQGDGIVIQAPGGRSFLVDGGSSNLDSFGTYRLEPFLKNQGIGHLDAILVSHTDNDHISGILTLLEDRAKGLSAISVGKLLLPSWENPPEVYRQLEELARQAGTEVCYIRAGDSLFAGKMHLEFLAPTPAQKGSDPNEDCMVFVLEYGEVQTLFTGDIGQETENLLLDTLPQVEILKVAHHGSRYSTGESFLEKVSPKLGIISCSEKNTYGHPSQETLERLEEAGVQLEYTMKKGAITVTTDGQRIWVERFLEQSDESL